MMFVGGGCFGTWQNSHTIPNLENLWGGSLLFPPEPTGVILLTITTQWMGCKTFGVQIWCYLSWWFCIEESSCFDHGLALGTIYTGAGLWLDCFGSTVIVHPWWWLFQDHCMSDWHFCVFHMVAERHVCAVGAHQNWFWDGLCNLVVDDRECP